MRKRGHGHAVPRPGTVMVHFWHTSRTMTTMMRPGRFGSRAFIAPALTIGLDNAVLEDITTRIDGNGAVVGYPEDEQETIEYNGFAT